MALDPNIALQVRPFQMESPVNALGQMYQLQGAQQANQLNAMKMAEYERARQEEEGVRNYLAGADVKAPEVRSELATKFGKTGLGYAKALAEQDAAALEQKIKQIDYTAKVTDAAANIYGTVKDEASWQAAKPKLAALGGDPKALPETYDPDFVRREMLAATKVKDQLTLFAPKPKEVKRGDGSIIFLDENPNSPTYGKEVLPSQAAGMTPYESGRLGFEGERVGLEKKRVGMEGQRIGMEGERLALAKKEDLRKEAGLEALPPKELQKREAALPQATSAIKGFESKSDSFVKDLEKLRDHPGLSQITGLVAGRVPALTAEGRAAQALYDKVVAKGGFQALQDLRDASKTGGALGNVSNQEGKQLTASFSAIDRRQDAKDVKAAIDQAIGDVQGAKTRMREAYDATYAYKAGKPAEGGVIDFGSLK